MKKYLFIILLIIIIVTAYFAILNRGVCLFRPFSAREKIECLKEDKLLKEACSLLKVRKDKEALLIFENILSAQPDNPDALWGKAEVLRRMRKFKESEEILQKILSKNPQHIPALISLSYIRYKDDKLNAAQKLINQVLKSGSPEKESQALAYMMLGTINSRRAAKGWLFSKIRYGTQIKCYFLQAESLSAELPEVHLGLGTFYLLAPAIAGGNLNKAIKELELAVKIAPEFATANARLAQAYKRKNDVAKFNYYFKRAQDLDPDNEALKEL